MGAMTDKTLYDILEVSPGASDEAIHRAYTFLSAKYDPNSESNRAKPEARVQHEAVKQAFVTLSNPERRAQYDKKLELRSAPAELKNVQVVEPFWTTSKLLVVALIVVVGGAYVYQHRREVARLETEKAIAAARAKAEEEKAKAEAELALQRERERRAAEERERRERDVALRTFSTDQQKQALQDRQQMQQAEMEKRRADAQRRQEETRSATAARQQLAREKAELCRIERERYGRAFSC